MHQRFGLRGLKKKDMESFRQHCLAGHRPWRADCTACLDSMAYTRPHRRMQRSRACTLSIDISCPHRATDAEDQEVSKPKFLIVGAYTFPIFGQKDEAAIEDAPIPSPSEFLPEAEEDE